MILDGYWDKRPSEEMKARILADWADVLEDYKQESILHALRKWRKENPNKKPNAGHILSILSEGWGRKTVREAQIAKEDPPERIIATEEQRRAILEESGLACDENGNVKLFDTLKTFCSKDTQPTNQGDNT